MNAEIKNFMVSKTTTEYYVHRDNLTVVKRGFGTFTYNFEFYPDNQFGTMVDPSSYPLEYDIKYELGKQERLLL